MPIQLPAIEERWLWAGVRIARPSWADKSVKVSTRRILHFTAESSALQTARSTLKVIQESAPQSNKISNRFWESLAYSRFY